MTYELSRVLQGCTGMELAGIRDEDVHVRWREGEPAGGAWGMMPGGTGCGKIAWISF